MPGIRKMSAIVFLCGVFLAPVSLRGIDPATMTAAAPQALELMAIWSPHTINAMRSGGIGMWKIGESLVEIFYLPLGICQATLGMPFGMFDSGIENCIKGASSPFLLVYHTLMLPVRIFSLGAVN